MSSRFFHLLKNHKAFVAFGTGIAALTVYKFGFYQLKISQDDRNPPSWTTTTLPSREQQVQYLSSSQQFDILVIGGGATGCGVALDAVTRGFKTALVEKYDFSSGTSSRSTKLIHGGVRYLQKAIMHLDKEQYLLVKEALHERANLLKIAPHLSAPLPIMLPVYQWWKVPYYWVGIKCYDLVAGSKAVKSSYLLEKSKALSQFPMLKKDQLKAAIVYYDGQHNDARMNLAIALTAIRHKACITNHTELVDLIKEKVAGTGESRITGAVVRDLETGNMFQVKAKVVINATGPFTDSIRKMDNPKIPNICQPSAGVHIILPGYYSPDNMGLLDPNTSDGRVIFFLPWENLTIAGTTDSPTDVTHAPAPLEENIKFILSEVKNYLSPEVHVRRGDVLAAWSGIRPLVTDPNSKNTKSISRNHVVEVSESGLVTIAGGKWTTYRSMAVDAVDAAVRSANLTEKRPSSTDGLILDGGYHWTPNYYIKLAQNYGLEADVAKHLSRTYGDHAEEVIKLAKVTGHRWPVIGKRLVDDLPYIEAEVRYAVYEYARSAVDVLARRTRIAFLNAHAAEEALPRVLEILRDELKWSPERVKEERKAALDFLHSEMGLKAKATARVKGITLSAIDVERYTQRFKMVDRKGNGFITRGDIQNLLSEINEGMDGDLLADMIDEVQPAQNGMLELEEFLELMSNIKSGHVSGNRLATLLKLGEAKKKEQISVLRSGGGI